MKDLATFQALPERFLAKILTRLEKAGLVRASEGVRGGFVLARPPERIAVHDVLTAVDPDRTLFECAEIRRHCAVFGEAPPAWSITGMCRIHLFMREAERALQQFLASKTLADLGREFERKAPEQFIREAESWFQLRRSDRTRRKRKTVGARHAKRAPSVTLKSKKEERKR